jgi:hypothetical protein
LNADASIAGIRAQVGELNTALAQVRTELHAGGDVNQNDKWTLRLLGLGVLMLGLSYPIGKIVWLASTAVTRRASGRAAAAEELLAFSTPAACKADTLVTA